MKTRLLIDNVMRQTTVLIAQLAVSAKIRSPIAHLADEVFVQLSDELFRQGVPQKVVADMFGVAFRGFQRKLNRLKESSTDSTTTLWEAVLKHVESNRSLKRADLVQRFSRDDPDSVRSVLRDLINVGLIGEDGRGPDSKVFAIDAEERAGLARSADQDTLRSFVWLDVGRHPLTAKEDIARRLSLSPTDLEQSLSSLQASGEVTRDSAGLFSAQRLFIRAGGSTGWETAVFDHFRAMCIALVTKLRLPQDAADHDTIGGVTYSFDVYPGHPKERQVRELLKTLKSDIGDLWQEVEDHNAEHSVDPESLEPVTFYFGQSHLPRDEEGATRRAQSGEAR